MTGRLEKARRIVVKVGSALLVDGKSGTLKASWLSSLVDDIADLRVKGADIILVSSGAIALGRRTLGLAKGKLDLPQKQAAAAVSVPADMLETLLTTAEQALWHREWTARDSNHPVPESVTRRLADAAKVRALLKN